MQKLKCSRETDNIDVHHSFEERVNVLQTKSKDSTEFENPHISVFTANVGKCHDVSSSFFSMTLLFFG